MESDEVFDKKDGKDDFEKVLNAAEVSKNDMQKNLMGY